MRILVTGAAGFVGQHLCAELADNGHEICATDQTMSGGINHVADLSMPYKAEGLIRRFTPDYVVHLAARYGRLLCADEPHKAVADNTAATVELAKECALRGIPILYTSSSEVYGNHGTAVIDEDAELRMPTTIYGLSKRWGEEALALYKVKRCIVRMNMLYGPGQLGGYGRCSLATFIQNAVAGESFQVHEGTTRSWLYISDAVRALRKLIEGGHEGVYNLGNPAAAILMTQVANVVVQTVGVGGYFEQVPIPERQIAHKHYNVRKLQETIPWEPEVGLEEGIEMTVDWARREQLVRTKPPEQVMRVG